MSIFGGIEPPAWLQQIAKPIDAKETGNDIGMMLGGGLLALQHDPDAKPNPDGTQPRKGFAKGINEARNNIADPNWQVKVEGLKAGVAEKWATAATTWQGYNDKSKNDALWATTELPAVTKWRDDLQKDPKAIPPIVETPQGQQAVQQIQTGEWRKAQVQSAAEIKKAQIENGSVAAKVATRHTEAFLSALETLPPDAASVIGEPKGPKIAGQETYSPEQWELLKSALAKSGLPMPGVKPTTAKPNAITPEQKVQLEDYAADAKEIRKQISTLQASNQKDKDVALAELRYKLAVIERKRRDTAAGKTSGKAATPAGATDAPAATDPLGIFSK